MNRTEFAKWLKNAVIRAVKSVAQTALASVGTASVLTSEFNWMFVLTTAGVAGAISLLMSLEKLPEDSAAEVSKTQPAESSGAKVAERAGAITESAAETTDNANAAGAGTGPQANKSP